MIRGWWKLAVGKTRLGVYNAGYGQGRFDTAIEIAEQDHQPLRGDAVEAWVKGHRDSYDKTEDRAWDVVDMLLDDYREHADTGTPLKRDVQGPRPEES